jgi:hypothetical protein
MQTFESVRHEYSPAHARFIEALLAKGLRFSGSVIQNGERFSTITATCGEVLISSKGTIELFTENINPYEPYDSGYHQWTLWDDDSEEADMLAGSILRMTGDD